MRDKSKQGHSGSDTQIHTIMYIGLEIEALFKGVYIGVTVEKGSWGHSIQGKKSL